MTYSSRLTGTLLAALRDFSAVNKSSTCVMFERVCLSLKEHQLRLLIRWSTVDFVTSPLLAAQLSSFNFDSRARRSFHISRFAKEEDVVQNGVTIKLSTAHHDRTVTSP